MSLRVEDRDGSETRSKEPHEPKAMPESDRRDGLCDGARRSLWSPRAGATDRQMSVLFWRTRPRTTTDRF